jgi:Ca2+/Na+ antiporter
MVDTINGFANVVGISPFYISFLVTPIASNASEVIAGLIFASKKTSKGISLTFGSLYGAACMNNTFGLAIFMGLIYFRELEWDFTTETLAIMGVTVLVGVNGLRTTIK